MTSYFPSGKESACQSLVPEDPLEEGMATNSSMLAWKSHEQRSLVRYSPWGPKESDTIEQLNSSSYPLIFRYQETNTSDRTERPIFFEITEIWWTQPYSLFTATHLFSSVAQSCPTLCNPMNLSTPGLPVHHQLPEFTWTHVHWVGDAIQLSHPLSSPSPPALNLCQHQGLFKWVGCSHQVAKVLEFQLQHQSFQWTPRTDFL